MDTNVSSFEWFVARSLTLVVALLLSAPSIEASVSRDSKSEVFSSARSEFEKFLFPSPLPDRRGPRTDGVVILHKGQVVFEAYANGYTRDQRHLTWSASKSVLNALVGIAVAEGRLNLEHSVCDYKPKTVFVSSSHCQIKIRHLLEWKSGLSWMETYEKADELTKSSVLQMLYGKGHQDMGRFVLKQKLDAEPGTRWRYSSGDSVYLSLILKWIYGDGFKQFVAEKFVKRLGLTSSFFELDPSGTFVGSSYFYASPRDLAKFGQLYLDDGVWNGKRLLPREWVHYSSTSQMSGANSKIELADGNGGAHFWLNRPLPERGFPSTWKDAPEDTIAAMGHWGQYIFIIPSREAVIVRVGDTRDGSFEINEFLKLGLKVVVESSGGAK